MKILYWYDGNDYHLSFGEPSQLPVGADLMLVMDCDSERPTFFNAEGEEIGVEQL